MVKTWISKISVGMTPEKAGKFIRNLAELAQQTNTWDDFEKITTGLFEDAYKAGRPRRKRKGE